MMDVVSRVKPERLYGRRKGRALHKHKAELVRDLLPELQIELPQDGFEPEKLFAGRPSEIWLEIGFGGGEHLAAQAAAHLDKGFIGCEPFINGIAGLLEHVDDAGLSNVRVFPDDARKIIDAMPDGSISRCFVLFPDPWPKKRHIERRFLVKANLDRLARVMKSGAELWFATDVAGLAVWMEEQASAHSAFRQEYKSDLPPEGWVQTRYEQKGIKAGRVPVYFRYVRK